MPDFGGEAPAVRASAAGGGDLLRVVACGSVDDGKSTLIGRLLYESGSVPDDVLAAARRDSRARGADGIDWSLLLDGLEAEREQGITIDVAYRYFSTPRRAFVLADAPGHDEYTRNMATAASGADVAVLLVDARKGLLPQTRRHAAIAALLGVRRVILAVNKMDLVGWDAARFAALEAEAEELARRLGVDLRAIPVAARHGDNLAAPSPATPWYGGPSLLEALEAAPVRMEADGGALRFAVQYVNRSLPDGARGLLGSLSAGRLHAGDPLVLARSGRSVTVSRILGLGGSPQTTAEAGDPVTLVLAEEVDVARGDLLVDPRRRPAVAREAVAEVIWLGEAALEPGRDLLVKLGHRTTAARVDAVRSRLDMDSLSEAPADRLQPAEIGLCELRLSDPLAFDPYDQDRRTGGFILIDRETGATLGAGLMRRALQAGDIHPEASSVTREARERLAGRRGVCVWLTGLSGSGKSTLADGLERRLYAAGARTLLLDGDNLRHGLNRGLGFSTADRAENVRRAAEAARLLVESGAVAIVALISPAEADRAAARALFPPGDFLEVHVATPLAACEARDAKGLYRRARAGEIEGFTGVDGAYEPPPSPELTIDASTLPVDAAADRLFALVEARTRLGAATA